MKGIKYRDEHRNGLADGLRGNQALERRDVVNRNFPFFSFCISANLMLISDVGRG